MEQNTEKAANKPLVYRKERKFIVPDTDVVAVEFFIKSHPALFFQPYPPRFVNNIYFDSHDFQNYGLNVVGSMERYKFRIRWYGEQFGYIEKPVLEIKIKKGLAGAKRNVKLAPFTIEPGFTIEILQDVFARTEMPEEIREMLKHQSPVLLNQYHRKYYLSADHKFRLTVDHKIRYTKINRFQNSFLNSVSNNNDIIVEVKYETQYDEEANKITSIFPFRLNKNSKYVNGLDELDCY